MHKRPLPTAPKTGEEITRDSLEFSARKSIRYLTKRKRFFDNLHYISLVINALGSGAVFAVITVGHPATAKWIALIVAIIAFCDICIGFTQKSDLYNTLQRRFADMLMDMISKPLSTENIAAWERLRLDIEKDEPPPLKGLEIMCYNEQLIAQGSDHSYLCHVPAIIRALAQWHSFDWWTFKRELDTKHPA